LSLASVLLAVLAGIAGGSVIWLAWWLSARRAGLFIHGARLRRLYSEIAAGDAGAEDRFHDQLRQEILKWWKRNSVTGTSRSRSKGR